ncbi:MAG: GNAT family N-acetyltransferase, partial [Candidatus Zixiibacteriota bacterium]
MGRPRKIIGEKCYLTPISKSDVDTYTRWINDLKTTIPLGMAHHPASRGTFLKQAEDLIQSRKQVYNIVTRGTEVFIGRIMLDEIDYIHRRAEMRLILGEKDYTGEDYDVEAIIMLLDYSFNILNLNSVVAIVPSINRKGIRAYKEAGFTIIGRTRESTIIAGEMYDDIWLDILSEEFRS